MMKALVFTTKDTAYVRDFLPPMSQTAEEVIGDWVELVRPKGIPGYLMLVDENGLLKVYAHMCSIKTYERSIQ